MSKIQNSIKETYTSFMNIDMTTFNKRKYISWKKQLNVELEDKFSNFNVPFAASVMNTIIFVSTAQNYFIYIY